MISAGHIHVAAGCVIFLVSHQISLVTVGMSILDLLYMKYNAVM